MHGRERVVAVVSVSHPEFLFDLAGVGLGIQAVHVVVDRSKLIGWNSGVPTETRLQDGVVDEDVLLLGESRLVRLEPTDAVRLETLSAVRCNINYIHPHAEKTKLIKSISVENESTVRT